MTERVADRWPAQYSDYLRVALLEQYGGFWVDATCFVTEDLANATRPYFEEGVLYPRWAGRQISNWFIAAMPHNLLIALQRAALDVWWRERDDLPDYFLYHRLFEVLLSLVPDARRMWRAVPMFSTVPCHVLQLAMLRPYVEPDISLLLGASFIHKLSYKYDYTVVPAGSILERLVREGSL